MPDITIKISDAQILLDTLEIIFIDHWHDSEVTYWIDKLRSELELEPFDYDQ